MQLNHVRSADFIPRTETERGIGLTCKREQNCCQWSKKHVFRPRHECLPCAPLSDDKIRQPVIISSSIIWIFSPNIYIYIYSFHICEWKSLHSQSLVKISPHTIMLYFLTWYQTKQSQCWFTLAPWFTFQPMPGAPARRLFLFFPSCCEVTSVTSCVPVCKCHRLTHNIK